MGRQRRRRRRRRARAVAVTGRRMKSLNRMDRGRQSGFMRPLFQDGNHLLSAHGVIIVVNLDKKLVPSGPFEFGGISETKYDVKRRPRWQRTGRRPNLKGIRRGAKHFILQKIVKGIVECQHLLAILDWEGYRRRYN